VGLHGFGSAAAAFDLVAQRLSGTVALWSADGFGHRGVPWPADVVDFNSGVRALIERIAHVPAPRYLLGYSMGGRLGLAAWAQRPTLFEGATLIGVHPGLITSSERAGRERLDRERALRLQQLGTADFFREWDALPLFEGRGSDDFPWRDEHDASALARAFELWSLAHQPDLRPTLTDRWRRGIAQLLVGQRDEKFKRLLAPWSPQILPGTHDLLTASPDLVARAVRQHRSRLASPER